MVSRGAIPAAVAVAFAAALLAGCGSGSGKNDTSAKAPQVAGPQSFPSARGKSIEQIAHGLGPGPVLAPAISITTVGDNRFTFGLFDRARRQISGAPVALYVAPVGSSQTYGPIPAAGYTLSVAATFDASNRSITSL